MIRLRDFELSDEDIQHLAPALSSFDYYFVITLWPTVGVEKDKLRNVVSGLSARHHIFSEASEEFDLCNIGFHLCHTTSGEVAEELKELRSLFSALTPIAGDKQLAGQAIGIYNPSSRSPSEACGHSSMFLREVGSLTKYTIASDKFGNLSYPPEGRDMTHVLMNENGEEPLYVSASHLSSNEIIYEFSEGERSRRRSSDAVSALGALWKMTPYVRDLPERGVYCGEFWWSQEGTAVTVGRFDPMAHMNICASSSTYPRSGSIGVEMYNEDKRNLFILAYDDTTMSEQLAVSDAGLSRAIRTIALPRINPFTMPRHVLISFSQR